MSDFHLPPEDWETVKLITDPAAPQEKHGIVVNDGFRFLCLGESGSGKTTLERAVVYMTIARGFAKFALIHDTKGIFPEFPQSYQVTNVSEFISRGGFPKGQKLVSFRGDARRDVECPPEEVAAFSMMLAQKGRVDPVTGLWHPVPHCTLIEEVAEAATGGGKHLNSPSVFKLATQGRKMGVSLIGTTQMPGFVPLPLLAQAQVIAFFRLTGNDANYLADRMKLNPDLVAAIRGPKNEGLPNFKYTLYVKGQTWDGKIRQLDKRTASMFE